MQKIIYTLQEVEGIVEYRFPPVETRVAKETLAAIIEELLIKPGYASSYSMTNSGEFSFPFDKPNITALNGFFGPSPDYNLIAKEMDALFELPKKELEVADVQLLADLKAADNDQLLAMVEKYHYEPEGTKEKYAEALEKLDKLQADFGSIVNSVRTMETSLQWSDLLHTLKVLDDCHARALVKEIQGARQKLDEGKRDEVLERIQQMYSSWRRQNLAKFYHACGNAIFYGAGSWVARIIAVEGEVEVRPRHMLDNPHKTAELVLMSMGMPCQVIEL